MVIRTLAAAGLLALAAAPAFALTQTLTFDSFASGDVVTTEGIAAFSTETGASLRALAIDFGTSAPNVLGAYNAGGGLDGFLPLYVDFSVGVSNLTFSSVGDDDVGAVATINVFTDGVFNAAVALVVDGVYENFQSHDLSAYSNITRLEIVDITDGGGLGYDDFSFTYGETSDVPLPAGAALLLTGLAALGLKRRS
ncbi:VPLPA-CTERM sorting domain-containing protein [Rhodovulum sp. DZ06]|uniref:VPLPA-CTERM sorting domain-containing protein n=1 Tax=Rhodovulum sp. DZ06 TaxID=3425126 RepID=UPI003D356B20